MNKQRVAMASVSLLLGLTVWSGAELGHLHRQTGVSVGLSDAQAYPNVNYFNSEVIEGGGGGRFFTGSLRDGYTCGVCHVSKELFSIEVTGLDEQIVPNKEYLLSVEWEGEAKRVGFNAEIVGPKGLKAGTLEALPEVKLDPNAKDPEAAKKEKSAKEAEQAVILAVKKERAIIAAGPASDRARSRVRFKWTAPDAKFKGPLSVHVAAVRKQTDEVLEKAEAADKKDKDSLVGQLKSPLLNDELAVYAASIPMKGASKSSSSDDKKGDKE